MLEVDGFTLIGSGRLGMAGSVVGNVHAHSAVARVDNTESIYIVQILARVDNTESISYRY